MKITEYKDINKADCLAIFDSNTPKYFSESEREQFEGFLDNETKRHPYFVVAINSSIVACGGYQVSASEGELTWGMVLGCHHKKQIGEALLRYRLNQIYRQKGIVTVNIDTSQYTKDFFIKYGFKVIRTIENGYGFGLHKIYMQYNL